MRPHTNTNTAPRYRLSTWPSSTEWPAAPTTTGFCAVVHVVLRLFADGGGEEEEVVVVGRGCTRMVLTTVKARVVVMPIVQLAAAGLQDVTA